MSGVREYWIVDPLNKIVEVYNFSENVYTEPAVYGKDETLNDGILDDLAIGLRNIFE